MPVQYAAAARNFLFVCCVQHSSFNPLSHFNQQRIIAVLVLPAVRRQSLL